MDPDARRIDDRAPGSGPDVVHRFAHGAERVEDVEPIAVEDLEVQEAREVVGGRRVRGLVHLRHRDAVAVVLDDEDNRQLLARSAVHRFVKVAFGGRGLADRAEDDRVLAVSLDRPAETRGVLGMVGDARRNVLNPDLRFREVVRHVPAARRDVRRFRHAVQEDLLGGQSRGDAGGQVAVVGEEVVPAGAEGHAERELDRVVPRAGGVVAPAEPLLQVVGGLVVEHTGQVHERVPLLQLLPGNPGQGGVDELGGFSKRQQSLHATDGKHSF